MMERRQETQEEMNEYFIRGFTKYYAEAYGIEVAEASNLFKNYGVIPVIERCGLALGHRSMNHAFDVFDETIVENGGSIPGPRIRSFE